MGRLRLYGAASTALSIFVIFSAWLQRRQFYPTCLHLTRSSASLMVLLNMGLYITILLGRALQRIFFGNLRALEVEMEQSPNLTVKFHARMIGIIALLYATDIGLLWYTVDYTFRRGASMMIIFGFEYTILISLIFSVSAKYVLHTIDLRGEHPWENKSMYIFYLELVVDFFKLITYFLFFAIVVHFYGGLPLHIIRDLYMTVRSFIQRCRDMIQYRRATANMNERYPDATAEELEATDRICIICREEMEVRGAARAPAAAAAAGANGAAAPPPLPPPIVPVLGGGNAAADANTPKKLQCGHIFHFRCLRSCRRSVLADNPAVPGGAAAAAAGPLGARGAPAGPANPAPAVPGAGVGVPFQQALQALWNQQQQQQQQQPQPGAQPGVGSTGVGAGPSTGTIPQTNAAPSTAGAAGTGVAGSTSGTSSSAPLPPPTAGGGLMFSLPTGGAGPVSNMSVFPFTLTPLTNFQAPLGGAHARTTPVFDYLTDQELEKMEGRSREAVVERIRAVQNVQEQLTGIVTQLTQILQMFPDANLSGVVSPGERGTDGTNGIGGGESSEGSSSSAARGKMRETVL
ncbi:E3 ubiquitin-protein ligase hrd1 [Phlyctochytrium planicorne]|nr:E3 ubiquitin-protein ligase hrd1 [Phlyctochytrium planicorne]